jgi:hypothetical protein
MKKLEIFEPSMCCSTGTSYIDNEMMRIESVLKEVTTQGGQMHRYNLATEPQIFLQNPKVIALLDNGESELPVTVLGGEIVLSKRYPTNEEIEAYLNVSLGNVKSAESNKNDKPKSISRCC